MITETQPCMIVLQLTDELLAQLQPFLAGLDIAIAPHNQGASQEVFAHVEQHRQRLTMRGEVYAALAEHVGGALDYEIRWQPNEYEPDGFIERVRPLELMSGTYAPTGCPQCGVQILANRAEVACACGWAVALL